MDTIVNASSRLPNIKRYSNVLTYLKDYYAFRKSIDPQFTQDLWSIELGFKSTSTMYLISSGRRPLTLKFIDTLANSLKLNDVEKNHLILLATYDKTKSTNLKSVLFNKILENLDTEESIVDAKSYFNFTASATMPVILVALAFDDIKGSAIELSQILNISLKKTLSDLKALEGMGLIKKIQVESTEENFWKPTTKDLVIRRDSQTNTMDLFHEKTLKEAGDALKKNDTFKRFRSILFAISPEDHALLLSEVENFLAKIKNQFRQKNMAGKHVVKLNLQAYPVSEIK